MGGVFHLRIKGVFATMMEMRDNQQQRVRGQLSRDVGGINNRLKSVRIQSAFVARGPKSVPPIASRDPFAVSAKHCLHMFR